jgi:hypothetical protein
MEKSRFGRGFVTNLLHISRHFGLSPEQAFIGASDHLDELILPEKYHGTELAELVTRLRKRILWHSPGSNDADEYREVNRLLDRIAILVDKDLGISDASPGEYQ